MSGMFGGGGDGSSEARRARADARRREQQSTEAETRARQRGERGGAGISARRGRGMLAGRLTTVLPSTLGGSANAGVAQTNTGTGGASSGGQRFPNVF